MTNSGGILKIIAAGVETSLQDAGRAGLRAQGIPQSGAADRLSFAAANMAAGNSWRAPALELAMGGLKVKALTDVRLAICGADMAAMMGGAPAPYGQAFTLKAGAELSFGFARFGARAYLACAGGFDGDVFAGSRSFYAPARLGGLKGRALKAGDELGHLGAPRAAEVILPQDLRPRPPKALILRVQKGPEFLSHCAPVSRRRLFTQGFTATSQTNRMGAQLSFLQTGLPPLELSDKTPLTSSPLLPGSLQITPDGTPILSGIDSHCTGGYARALSVITVDHWLMGQIAPGSQIYFRRVTTQAALLALRRRNMIYGQFIKDFRFD